MLLDVYDILLGQWTVFFAEPLFYEGSQGLIWCAHNPDSMYQPGGFGKL